ncbi:type II toxin-antitoxin system RelE/ParE family toxin [Sulfurovum mangrovi]|uniref:type II toxin-antitoxin system RelE/ParE family toxin n=1 Tax=Sulfurovum mangrovi TaxID=2893889 RepID=UPI001E3E1419|nr:type II toxin-antitoxin system RelE/ParE family toxin [Sulfurovum mangrovi]UFH59491.1 type II toxin-antitoxin system RelE/ParE family toxin [Sulfurovum mangrovi]UFH60643.1 type II toxin-antitoxin system RelE/ParE family toxin [Sulfurovum mangrovi]
MKKISALFYENSNGKKPVREWLYSLDEEDRKVIGKDIKTVEYGWPIGMPVCRKLESKLYEVRSDISDKRIARVIFTVIDEYMILLHGFIKKTQKTPKQDIDLALKRKKDIQ